MSLLALAHSQERKFCLNFDFFLHCQLFEEDDVSLANHHSLWSKASSDSSSNGDGQCIWYGTCEGCIPGHADYNIAYNGPAKPLTDESDIETLKGVCPELFHHLGK